MDKARGEGGEMVGEPGDLHLGRGVVIGAHIDLEMLLKRLSRTRNSDGS